MSDDQFVLEIWRQIFDFIPKFLSAIAWPLSAAVIVYLLRDYLRKLLERLRKAETKIGDFTFEEAIAEVKEEVLKIEGGTIMDSPTPAPQLIYQPVAEVLSSWAHVERLGQKLLRKHAGQAPQNYRALGLRLKQYELIDPEHAAILDKLRQIRNIAAHSERDITPQEVAEYQQLTDRMVVYLNSKLGDEPTPTIGP